MNFSLGPFREDPGRSNGGSRLGGSPAAGALGSGLRDKGLEEAEEFSWEVCFSSVGISGPGASALALAERSDLRRRCCCSEQGFQRLCFQLFDAVASSSVGSGFSTLESWSSRRGAA